MNGYNGSEAYDLSLLNMPAVKLPEQEQFPQQEHEQGRQQNNKARVTVSRKTVQAALHAFRVVSIAAVLLILFAGILFTRIKIESLDKEADRIQALISDAESEQTRLKSQLSSAISREKIEEYAISELGMHKLERYQIRYFEERSEDRVVLAGGKVPAAQIESEN